MGPTRSAAHSARASWPRQTTTIAVGLAVCSNLCPHNNFDSCRIGRLFQFANFTAENAIGSKSGDQNLNRIKNSSRLLACSRLLAETEKKNPATPIAEEPPPPKNTKQKYIFKCFVLEHIFLFRRKHTKTPQKQKRPCTAKSMTPAKRNRLRRTRLHNMFFVRLR